MKKAITQLTESELLDLIKSEPSSITLYEWPTDVMQFISVYNLKSGTERITTKLLYKLYKLWSKNPVPRKTLTTTLMDLFPSDRIGESHLILLNKETLNIKQETLKYLKKHNKTKDKGWMEHFTKYLHEYCIESGCFYIKDTVLYNLYDKWCYKKRSPLALAQFNNFCKLYFKNKFIKKNYWFAVDEKIQKYLTEDLIKEMRDKRAPKKKYKTS